MHQYLNFMQILEFMEKSRSLWVAEIHRTHKFHEHCFALEGYCF